MKGDGGRVVKEIEGKPRDSGFSTSNKRRYIKKEDLLYSTENCTQYLVRTFKVIFPESKRIFPIEENKDDLLFLKPASLFSYICVRVCVCPLNSI